jgi:hypothetical protein
MQATNRCSRVMHANTQEEGDRSHQHAARSATPALPPPMQCALLLGPRSDVRTFAATAFALSASTVLRFLSCDSGTATGDFFATIAAFTAATFFTGALPDMTARGGTARTQCRSETSTQTNERASAAESRSRRCDRAVCACAWCTLLPRLSCLVLWPSSLVRTVAGCWLEQTMSWCDSGRSVRSAPRSSMRVNRIPSRQAQCRPTRHADNNSTPHKQQHHARTEKQEILTCTDERYLDTTLSALRQLRRLIAVASNDASTKISVSVSYVVWEYSASIVYEAIPHVRSY